MLPIERLEYLDEHGRNPFRRWYLDLDDSTAARINRALERLSEGNTSNVKFVGGGVSELRLDFGPGYRVYFGCDGLALVILLGGGTKHGQQNDIANAQNRWRDYKRRRSTRA
jgi:putative addiction module killer protein